MTVKRYLEKVQEVMQTKGWSRYRLGQERKNAVSEMQTPTRQNNIIRITGPESAKAEVAENDMFENQTLEVIDDRSVFENQTYEDDNVFANEAYETTPCTDFKH